MQLTRKDGKADGISRYYIFPAKDIQDAEDENIRESYSESVGEFIYTVEQYNIYGDYDEYFISFLAAERCEIIEE